jgi:hypothetical protein
MNLVAFHDISANIVNIYGTSQTFFKKLAIDNLENGALIALSGFILDNV